MKRILIITMIGLLVATIVVAAWSHWSKKIDQDRKHRYFGRTLTEAEYKEVKKKNEETRKRFPEAVARLNAGWDQIDLGLGYVKDGNYEKAIEAFKKSYQIDPGNGLTSGDHLIECYERLGRFDEAIAVVDEILKNQPLAEVGVSHYKSLRAKLVSAKSQKISASGV